MRDVLADAECVIQGERRRRRVGGRAYAADSLRDALGVAWIATAKDDLQASKEQACAVGLLDDAPVHDRFDLEMTFDARDRIDDDRPHGGPPCIEGFVVLTLRSASTPHIAARGPTRTGHDAD